MRTRTDKWDHVYLKISKQQRKQLPEWQDSLQNGGKSL
jgi:hypothetical protein